MQDSDQELERDIGYALSQSVFKVKGQRIEALRLVARGVVEHLRRAGWGFALKPPGPLHGPSGWQPEPSPSSPARERTADAPIADGPTRQPSRPADGDGA